MAACRVGVAGGTALAAALATGTSLECLDLHDNPMEPSAAPAIASLIGRHQNLTKLILTDLCLQDEGAQILAQALAAGDAANKLQVLDLGQNEITKEATPALARALATRARSLRHVILSDNEMECAGAIHVATGLRDAKCLEVLELKNNQIGRVGALEVTRCCCNGKSGLKRVELDENQISAEGVAEVRVALLKTGFVFTARMHLAFCTACCTDSFLRARMVKGFAFCCI